MSPPPIEHTPLPHTILPTVVDYNPRKVRRYNLHLIQEQRKVRISECLTPIRNFRSGVATLIFCSYQIQILQAL